MFWTLCQGLWSVPSSRSMCCLCLCEAKRQTFLAKRQTFVAKHRTSSAPTTASPVPPPARRPPCRPGGESGKLRGRLETNFTFRHSLPVLLWTLMRKDRVVPLAVEVGALKPNGLHLASAHLDANRILPSIESRLDAQPRGRAGTANEADDHLAAQQ